MKKAGLSWLLLWGFLASSLHAGEAFRYELSYRGIFSAMQKVRIADVRLWIGGVDADGRRSARLTVTSAPYGLVENLYPFRLCAKSLFSTRRGRPRDTLLYGLENQSGGELEERLLWLDWPRHQMKRFQREVKPVDLKTLRAAAVRLSDARRLLRELEGGKVPDLPAAGVYPLPREVVFDRLSLFLLLRELEWKPGDRRDFRVAVDDELLRYRLSFLRRERIAVGGITRRARRIEMSEFDEQGKVGHVVTFWIGDEAPHPPLKGHSAHALGDFVMRLVDWSAASDEAEGCAAPGFAFLRERSKPANDEDDWF